MSAIGEQLKLLSEYLDPAALKTEVAELEQQMGEPGFWDDPDTAGRLGAQHARATKRLDTFASLERDAGDLDSLVELAE